MFSGSIFLWAYALISVQSLKVTRMSQHIGASEVNPFSPGNCCGWRNVNVPSLNVYVFLSHFCNNVILNYRFYKAGFFTSFSLLSTQHGFFRRLQKGGRVRWMAAKKHAILRPFAWLYQAVRLLGFMVKYKKRPGEILKYSRQCANQRQLIEKLDIGPARTLRRK